MIPDFYRKEAPEYAGYVQDEDGAAIDISGDTVKLLIKTSADVDDDAATKEITCDVTTNGANGYYYFFTDPDDTDIDPDKYVYEITRWFTSNGNECNVVLDSGQVKCLLRVRKTVTLA